MFRVQMKGRPQEEGIDFGRLASLTENYVSADIAWIVNDAAEKAFEERAGITEKMLEDAIKRTRPSVGPDDIRYYESLRERSSASTSCAMPWCPLSREFPPAFCSAWLALFIPSGCIPFPAPAA